MMVILSHTFKTINLPNYGQVNGFLRIKVIYDAVIFNYLKKDIEII